MRFNKQTNGSLMLLTAAMIWGGAFIAQSAGMNYIRPFTYSAIRFYIGCIVLLPLIYFMSRGNSKDVIMRSIKGGVICGCFLFLGNTLQQYGLTMTQPGKAGFISALYLMFVPLIAFLVFRKKIEKHVWFGIALAIVGFYFLCIRGEITIQTGDLLILGCAFAFSFQILGVDFFTNQEVDPILVSFFQFLTTAVISTIFIFIFDDISISNIIDAKWTILYAGVLSSGVAYTFQVIGQKEVEPTVASLIMSLESVFAVLSEWVIYHTSMSAMELFGCLLVFTAVIIVQLPAKKKVEYVKN